MNSTIESFSENAWDNYQDPLYPTMSDDPMEEKLDDSKLLWEENSLDFEDDDFLLPGRPLQRQKKVRNNISLTPCYEHFVINCENFHMNNLYYQSMQCSDVSTRHLESFLEDFLKILEQVLQNFMKISSDNGQYVLL